MDNFKDSIKVLFKSLLKSKIFIMIIILVFVLAVLLPAFVYYITIDDGTYKEGDWSSTPYVASTYTQNVTVGSDGITSNVTAQELWDKMIEEGANVQDYLDSPEELEKLMNAEIITQYPKIGAENAKLDGIIEFKRYKTDGTSCMLEYIDTETFNKYIEESNTDIVNYFTLDENGDVLIGILNETTETLSSNDSDMNLSDYTDTLSDTDLIDEGNYSKTEYSIYSKPIYYKNAISKYTMPFQYLWSFIVIGDDKGIGLELADLVEDSEIIISIYDNITTTVDTSTYTYNKERKVDVSASATSITSDGGRYSSQDSWSPANEWIEDEDYEITHIITHKDNTPLFDIEKADVWMVDYNKSYTYQASEQTLNDTNEKNIEDEKYVDEVENPKTSSKGDGTDLLYYDKFSDKLNGLKDSLQKEVEKTLSEGVTVSTYISSCSNSYYIHKINRHEVDVSTESSQKYVEGDISNEPKIQKKTDEEITNGAGQNNFVTILCDNSHSEARKKITEEVSSWLFELLENNPDTVNMIELTKRLLNEVLGKEQFDTDFSFDEFANNSFTEALSIYGSNFEEKVWFALLGEGYSKEAVAGAMGNFKQESGFRSNNLQDTYESKLGMTDETYTNAVNNGTYTNFANDGAGYGLAQWTFPSRKEALYSYANDMGVGIDDEDMQIRFLIKEIKEKGCTGWQNATSVEEACEAFEREFENAGNPQMGNRLTYAKEIYEKYKNQDAPSGSDVDLTGDNKTKMQALLQEAQRIANDDRYTYSQSNRYGAFQYDCSSFVSRLYAQFFAINVPSTTSAYGTQYRVGASTSVQLQPGDVLWRSGHVTLYIGNGIYAAAHSDSGKYASNPAAQISVYNDSPSKYTYVYRFINN